MNESQKQRAEENRLKALQIRQQKLSALKAHPGPSQSTPQGNGQGSLRPGESSHMSAPLPKHPRLEAPNQTVSSVPPDVKKRIEENRRKAIERREALKKAREQGLNVPQVPLNPKPPHPPPHPPPSDINPKPPAPKLQLRTVTVTLVLSSTKNFIADMPQYHTGAIQVFRSMPSKTYDPQTRKWSFSLTEHNKLKVALKPLKSEVEVKPIPLCVLAAVEAASKRIPVEILDLTGLDGRLHGALMPFQVDGVKFGISLGGRVLIADEMGLGKTIQGLGIASYYRSEWPLLIVTQSSTRYSWEESVLRWVSTVRDNDVIVMTTGSDSFDGAKVVITSYDLLSRKGTEMMKENFGVVILDESHMIKNYKTARYKAAAPIVKKAKRVILLSGTPALSRPIELYTQIQCVNPSLFPQFQDYGVRYCEGRLEPWGWTFKGSSNTQELQVLLQSCVWIRRLKSEVLSQLPPKQRMTVVLDPHLVKDDKGVFDEMLKKFKGRGLIGPEDTSDHFQFFGKTAEAKVHAVREYLKEVLESGKKFIVFAHHKVMMEGLAAFCRQNKTEYVFIDGKTSAEKRKECVESFQCKESIRVAILSITAANTGITLTAAQMVIFAELYWNPGALVQAEDRAHRIGQNDSVLVQYLLAKKTADDHIWPLIQNKLEVLGKVGLSDESLSDNKLSFQKSAAGRDIRNYMQSGNTTKNTCQREANADSDIRKFMQPEENQSENIDLNWNT